jgi:hypothetical protein
MNSPLISAYDVAAEEQNNRDMINNQRRDNYKYRKHLSNDIMPFKNGRKRQGKEGTRAKEFFSNDTYIQLEYCSSSTKPTIFNAEVPLVDTSHQATHQDDLINMNLEMPQEELIAELEDELGFNQNSPFSSKDNDELGIQIFFIVFSDSSLDSINDDAINI